MKPLLGAAFLFGVLALVVGATWFQAQHDLADAYAACMSEREFVARVTRMSSADELDRYLAGVTDCVERHKSFMAGLYSDREDTRRRLQDSLGSEGRQLLAQKQLLEKYEEQVQALQGDFQSRLEHEQFRERANQTGRPPAQR